MAAQLRDPFVSVGFGETLELPRQVFALSNGVKVFLLMIENPSSDVFVRLASTDKKLVENVTAWLDISKTRLKAEGLHRLSHNRLLSSEAWL